MPNIKRTPRVTEIEVDMTEALAKVDAELAGYKTTRMNALWQSMTNDDDFDMNKAREDLKLEIAAKRSERLEEERAKIIKEMASHVDEAEVARVVAEQNSDNEPLMQRRRKRKRDAEIRDKRKGKAVVVDSDYDPSVETEAPCDTDGDHVDDEASQKPTKETWGIDEYFHAFLGCTFAGTIYPDEETTKTLGIHGDYVHLMSQCGLYTYMGKKENTYPEAAAEFLATVKYYEAKGAACILSTGGGHLDFTISGVPYMITLNELTKLFGFPTGEPTTMRISKEERQRVWKYLSGSECLASSSKGCMRIRSPVVSYVRRAIAETFRSRADTGATAACDLSCLIPGIAVELMGNRVGGKKLEGDPADGSLAFALAKQLESYKTTVKVTKTKITPITIGGPITAILRWVKAKGIDFDIQEDEKLHPRLMDLAYLRHHEFLAKEEEKLLYRFRRDGKELMIELPRPEMTTFEDPLNIEFLPAEEYVLPHIDVSVPEKTPPIAPSSKKRASLATQGMEPKDFQPLTEDQLETLHHGLWKKLEVLLNQELETSVTPEVVKIMLPMVTAELTPLLMGKLESIVLSTLEPLITQKVEEQLASRMQASSSAPPVLPPPPTITPPSRHIQLPPVPGCNTAAPLSYTPQKRVHPGRDQAKEAGKPTPAGSSRQPQHQRPHASETRDKQQKGRDNIRPPRAP